VSARNKPSSVTRRSGEGSFLWDRHCCRPHAAYPGLRWRGPRLVPYLALLRVGFTMRPLLPAARCALTAPFHPCLCSRGGTLPYGARTFLQQTRGPTSDPYSHAPYGREIRPGSRITIIRRGFKAMKGGCLSKGTKAPPRIPGPRLAGVPFNNSGPSGV